MKLKQYFEGNSQLSIFILKVIKDESDLQIQGKSNKIQGVFWGGGGQADSKIQMEMQRTKDSQSKFEIEEQTWRTNSM